MSQREWARNEIEIAMKRENPEYIQMSEFNKKVSDFLDRMQISNDKRPKRFRNPFDYGCACYESAFKAFSSLCEDGHSGMSFGFTKNILERLMEGRPLTPIEDVPENWDEGSSRNKGEYMSHQCSRMFSLFKDIYPDGTVKYHDIDRVVGVSPSGGCYHVGYLQKFIDELYPIILPYSGTSKPYYIYTEDYLSDPKHGDFDTVVLLYMTTPDGEKIDILKYLGETENGFGEISLEEFMKRKAKHEELMKERGVK